MKSSNTSNVQKPVYKVNDIVTDEMKDKSYVCKLADDIDEISDTANKVVKTTKPKEPEEQVHEEYNYFQYWRDQPTPIEIILEDANKMDLVTPGARDESIPTYLMGDISPEERRAKNYREKENGSKILTSQIKTTYIEGNGGPDCEEQQFNTFQFWREPLINFDLPYQDTIMASYGIKKSSANDDRLNHEDTLLSIEKTLKEQTNDDSTSGEQIEKNRDGEGLETIGTLRELYSLSEDSSRLEVIMTILNCKEILETFRRNDISAERVLTLRHNDLREMRLGHRLETIFKTNRERHKQKIQEILEQ